MPKQPKPSQDPIGVGLAGVQAGGNITVSDVTVNQYLAQPASQPTSPVSGEPVRILFLASSPAGLTRLGLEEESRVIAQALRAGDYARSFDLVQNHASRIADLQDLLLYHKPHILHFSGHGIETGEIVLEDDTGNIKPVSPVALGRLLASLSHKPRLVVLNACFSRVQADAIAQQVDCVVGTSTVMTDQASRHFAESFYRALASGESVAQAFGQGQAQIDLNGLAEADTPQLIPSQIDPAQIIFVGAGLSTPVQPPMSAQTGQPSSSADLSYDAFISYAPADQDWVEQHLFPRLDDANVAWIDQQGFAAGVSKEIELERVVTHSTRTLLILSPSYLTDQWRRDDSLLAGHFGLSINAWPIVPVLIAPCTLPLRLSMLTPVDLTTDSSKQWQRLLNALQTRPTA